MEPRLDHLNSQRWPPGTVGAHVDAQRRALSVLEAQVVHDLRQGWRGRLVLRVARLYLSLTGRRWRRRTWTR